MGLPSSGHQESCFLFRAWSTVLSGRHRLHSNIVCAMGNGCRTSHDAHGCRATSYSSAACPPTYSWSLSFSLSGSCLLGPGPDPDAGYDTSIQRQQHQQQQHQGLRHSRSPCSIRSHRRTPVCFPTHTYLCKSFLVGSPQEPRAVQVLE